MWFAMAYPQQLAKVGDRARILNYSVILARIDGSYYFVNFHSQQQQHTVNFQKYCKIYIAVISLAFNLLLHKKFRK